VKVPFRVFNFCRRSGGAIVPNAISNYFNVFPGNFIIGYPNFSLHAKPDEFYLKSQLHYGVPSKNQLRISDRVPNLKIRLSIARPALFASHKNQYPAVSRSPFLLIFFILDSYQ